MQLKTYQQTALNQLDRWIDALKEARLNSEKATDVLKKQKLDIPEELKNYPLTAWNNLKKQGVLPRITRDGETVAPDYIPRTATSGEPIPHVCMKIPTGGGKTLLGVAALERLKQGDTGFVLWIVPTKAIYQQTITAFKHREHPYRVMLERASGGKVKLLEKDDQFTRQDVESYLCIMMLMLPSANRQKGKEFLKIFRDNGGYTSFFPEQDDATANQKLAEECGGLEKNSSGDWIKHSLINVLKQVRPTVILDEAHKAYGKKEEDNKEFVKSVNRLNPRFVLELSATPKTGISNILVNIGGTELNNEEMIKLPIEIHSYSNSDWKYTLVKTQDKLSRLEKQAHKLKRQENRYIRPIALVRVQRTGKEQRQPGLIHSEDVREYLIQNLGVPENQIRVQSSEQKELAGEDLLSETSPVRWIITKNALQEGWDCPFAYILALLDNTTATTALTQMIGRVLRQPHVRRIKDDDSLNQCYIYCYNRDVGSAVNGVKTGLENEGLTGLGDSIRGYGEGDAPKPVTVQRRSKYKKLKIFLPQVLHQEQSGWRPIDYDRDILSALDWAKIDGGEAVKLDDQDIIREIKTTVDIQGQGAVLEENLDTGESMSLDYFVRRLVDVIPNPWQAARVAAGFIDRHKSQKHTDAKLLNNRIYLAEVLRRRVKAEIDGKAEAVFRNKVRRNEIRFHLETDEKLDYDLNKSFEVFVSSRERALQREHGKPIQQSLFEPVYESSLNHLETDFALYLEESNAIHWWHRIAARQAYHLQGWRRQRVYPDFVACQNGNGRLLILETKGRHLQGNEDTHYKEKLLETLERTYQSALHRGECEVGELSGGPRSAVFRMLFEDNWQEEINDLVAP